VTLAAAAVQILPGPACPHCKGGRVINGVPCDGCEGSGRQPAPRRRWRWLRGRLRGAADAAAVPAGTLVRGLPGVGGAAVFTAGAAMVVHGVFRQVPLLGVAALVAGVFGLLMDRRL
jgi:hypothetical protein